MPCSGPRRAAFFPLAVQRVGHGKRIRIALDHGVQARPCRIHGVHPRKIRFGQGASGQASLRLRALQTGDRGLSVFEFRHFPRGDTGARCLAVCCPVISGGVTQPAASVAVPAASPALRKFRRCMTHAPTLELDFTF